MFGLRKAAAHEANLRDASVAVELGMSAASSLEPSVASVPGMHEAEVAAVPVVRVAAETAEGGLRVILRAGPSVAEVAEMCEALVAATMLHKAKTSSVYDVRDCSVRLNNTAWAHFLDVIVLFTFALFEVIPSA